MRLIGVAVVLVLLSACTVRPAFIPAPQKAFDQFVALPRPTRELAVGALWIDPQGPYGPGAAPDNLEVLPGISAVTIDRGLQASLSLGFLQFLNLDPSLHDKIQVRLNDVTIVRVKDFAKLSGPDEQPRVYEALRVGSATITTIHDIGLDIQARTEQLGLPVFGRSTSARIDTFTIEAKDVFLAVRIATRRDARSDPIRADLSVLPEAKNLDGLRIETSRAGPGDCERVKIAVGKGAGIIAGPTELSLEKPVELALAAPVGAGEALYTRLEISKDKKLPLRCSVLISLKGYMIVP